VARPGLTEVELQDALEDMGLEVEMWPAFDAYDLRIRFTDTIWAVDVKDWNNPIELARHAQYIPEKPNWDKAFYVFPDERKRQRSDYLQAFTNHWKRPPNTTAMMEKDFLRHVRNKLRGDDDAQH
jgi:hypothetical protein